MKKIIAIILASILMLSFTACGAKTDEKTEETPNVTIASPVELLNTVWNSYADDEKFPVAGGDMTEANMNQEGPGVYDISDAEGFVATTHFPTDSMAKIDSAATVMHMMNANTFTGAAYHLVEGTDAEALTSEVKESILATQWMCGFPEKLAIVTVEDYMISYFGNGELVDTFTAKLKAAYPTANVAVDEAIVA